MYTFPRMLYINRFPHMLLCHVFIVFLVDLFSLFPFTCISRLLMDISSQLACEKIYTIVFLKKGCQAKNVMVRVALYTGLSSVVLILA